MDNNPFFTFQCKKWTLFSFCLLNFISTLIIVIIMCVAFSQITSIANDDTADKVGKVAIGITAGIGSINMLINLMGLMGALKEHYCMTLGYAITMTVLTVLMIVVVFVATAPAFWFTFVLNIFIVCLAYLYARDLRSMQFPGPQTTVIMTTSGQPATFVVPQHQQTNVSYTANNQAPGGGGGGGGQQTQWK
ncbi:uncharacterized protein LOC128956914 [Oppia nitens]|uniref:uncharacterized protein LOC128956914 n=1 Tax=Oppia nitens TaxID=1686743 RepID=UPI0023DC76CC|nr:uncharacterized protein LOC128956914 [Oppia nitens]